LAEASLDVIDTAHAVELAKANALIAIYWELRHQRRSPSARGAGVSPPDNDYGSDGRPRSPEPGT
jgi:hypothetical protein